MFLHDNEDGSKTIILDGDDERINVEFPGGNGDFIRVGGDGSVYDQDGTDMLRAYLA